jgi:DNA-binding response OmpR family regulator
LKRAKIAVFNAHPETVEMLHLALQAAGFDTVDGPLREFDRGVHQGLAFLREHAPDAVIYDISPPYERTASFCCDLQEADGQRAWVITSTNPKRTARDLRTRPERYELIGKPYDLDDVIAAVQRAVKKNANLESIRAKGDHRIDT